MDYDLAVDLHHLFAANPHLKGSELPWRTNGLGICAEAGPVAYQLADFIEHARPLLKCHVSEQGWVLFVHSRFPKGEV